MLAFAPTTRETRTNICDLGLTVETFCPVATSRGFNIHSSDHRLLQHYFNDFCFFFCFFFSSRAFLTARRSKGTGLFYWAASRHRLFLYWPVSRCACGREGISPDLPLPGWEATARHSWAGEGEEVAEGWKVSVEIVVRGEILKQQAGSEGGGCCMGKDG